MRKHGRIQPQHVDPFQEQAHAQPAFGQLPLDCRQQVGAVDGAEMVHVTVGTANALNGIINAARDNIPVLLAAGRTPLTETGSIASRNRPGPDRAAS